jgi:hypothetical protein
VGAGNAQIANKAWGQFKHYHTNYYTGLRTRLKTRDADRPGQGRRQAGQQGHEQQQRRSSDDLSLSNYMGGGVKVGRPGGMGPASRARQRRHTAHDTAKNNKSWARMVRGLPATERGTRQTQMQVVTTLQTAVDSPCPFTLAAHLIPSFEIWGGGVPRGAATFLASPWGGGSDAGER